MAERPFEYFHLYAFNTLRQLGANYELFNTHLTWLSGGTSSDLDAAAVNAKRISEICKTTQFQLARAVMRKKFDKLATVLDPASEAWDQLVENLEAHTRKASSKAA